jgi:hypothetical protein
MTTNEVIKSLEFLKGIELKDLQGLNSKYTKTLYDLFFTDFDVIEQYIKEQVKKNEPKSNWQLHFRSGRRYIRTFRNDPVKYFEAHKRMLAYWQDAWFPATLMNLKTKKWAVIEKLPTQEELEKLTKELSEV